ncbi:MAG: FAD-dependent oxidoreductase [Rhodanobacteraceae bacterium]|nr:MAG: FAD-dependent oxidoreductase [Rhodanobacteraceae bacterium]
MVAGGAALRADPERRPAPARLSAMAACGRTRPRLGQGRRTMSGMNRAENRARLERESFDVLVIGGGATGAGVALDAASRGLSVALVERDDFASGTSSRSTKLVHGGVRYLDAAVMQRDRAQFHLVREALAERAILLDIAPHLVHPLRTVVPAYTLRQAIFYRVGLWLYDRAAGAAAIGRSHFLSRAQMLASFPRLKQRGLKGGVAYYDGQFDDARMALAVLATAARESALVVNRVEVVALREAGGRLAGAYVRDRLDGRSFNVHARAVVNATGPGSDAMRRMEHPEATPLLEPSRGTHLALDRAWVPKGDGLLIPKTPDGRVLFLLPWQGGALAGTTDVATAPSFDPEPTDAEIDYLLAQLGEWLQPAPDRAAVCASWAGLRPLIAEAATRTANIVREHHIEVGPKGLVTIAGGKWTTYRRMAEETVDRLVETAGLNAHSACRTRELRLVGAEGFDEHLPQALATRHHLDADIADHLAHAYGGLAEQLLEEAGAAGMRRLAADHPYIEAEVCWAQRHEMAITAEDVLARRMRLAFLDARAATEARPRVQAMLAGCG